MNDTNTHLDYSVMSDKELREWAGISARFCNEGGDDLDFYTYKVIRAEMVKRGI